LRQESAVDPIADRPPAALTRCNNPRAGRTFPPEMLASWIVLGFNLNKLCYIVVATPNSRTVNSQL
jgi:hypothetical protein